MEVKLYQVDAFTDQPFNGNPAAVCLLSGPREEAWMQNVASEMNLSETAFLHQGKDGFNLRWFTPTVEVSLCGHATLASAHILWETGLLSSKEQARFQTASGLLTAKKQGEEIELNFPATPPKTTSEPPGLAEALGVVPEYVGANQYDYLVKVGSESEVGAGIDEDPVTGSAHCTLGPYWGEILGKQEMVAYQASARGGIVQVRVGPERVYLGGRAVTVFRGELLV